MSRPVVLVHGAWGQAAAWGPVIADLEARGISVHAPDLPGRGSRAGEPHGTLHDDAEAVRRAITALDGPVVLCGHSYAGMVVSEASAGNDQVDHLVYLCAFQTEEGESLMDVFGRDPDPRKLGDAIRMGEDGVSTLDRDGARAALFNDMSDDQFAQIYPALGGQRMSAFSDVPTGLGWKEHGSTYVVSTDDEAVSTQLQRTMAAHADTVVEIDAGHLPMLSQPRAVADVLADAAG